MSESCWADAGSCMPPPPCLANTLAGAPHTMQELNPAQEHRAVLQAYAAACLTIFPKASSTGMVESTAGKCHS